MRAKILKIELFAADRSVKVNGKKLDPGPSQKVWDHSPDGFNWGYGGSGPAQLALAILLFAGVHKDEAVHLHQNFKWDFIARQRQGQDASFEVNLEDWLAAED